MKGLIQFLKFLFISMLVRCGLQRHKREKRILLIRNDRLGDFMLSLPVMRQISLQARQEETLVAIVVDKSMEELAKKCSFFDEVIPISLKELGGSFGNRIRTYRFFARLQTTKVINFLVFGRSAIEDYISYFSPAPEKYVMDNMDSWPLFEGQSVYRRAMNPHYTNLPKYDSDSSLLVNEARLASVAMNKTVFPALGDLDFLKPLPATQVKEDYYLIVPGAMDWHQRWNPEKFAAVIDFMVDKYPSLTPVLSGCEMESDIMEDILVSCQHRRTVINLCGKSNLFQLIGNVAGARFLLTNDTGPLHVAAKLRIPSFCIMGQGHWGVYNPNPLYESVTYLHGVCDFKRCNWICRKMKNPVRFPCVEQVSAERVIRAIQKYLET